MSRPTKAEIASEIADRDWWREIAAVFGMQLHGWSYRQSATFHRVVGLDHRGYFECPGDVALVVRRLAGLKP